MEGDALDNADRYDRGTPRLELSLDEARAMLAGYLAGRPLEALEPLAGGFLNTNYRIAVGGADQVLRISNRPGDALAVEVAVLRNLGREIPAPRVVHFEARPAGDAFPPHAVLTYLPGRPLGMAEEEFTPADVAEVGAGLGRILASIHRRTFPASGDFGTDFLVRPWPGDFSEAIARETSRCLASERLKSRLSAPERDRLAAVVEAHAPALTGDLLQDRLTHSDFNPKNVLVARRAGRWEVTGILDWEFAFSGPCLYDFGNLFRFEEELPPYREPLVRSYREHGGRLPGNWRAVARFLDLLPQLQFLARDAETPRTFETARAVIRRTIAAFDPA